MRNKRRVVDRLLHGDRDVRRGRAKQSGGVTHHLPLKGEIPGAGRRRDDPGEDGVAAGRHGRGEEEAADAPEGVLGRIHGNQAVSFRVPGVGTGVLQRDGDIVESARQHARRDVFRDKNRIIPRRHHRHRHGGGTLPEGRDTLLQHPPLERIRARRGRAGHGKSERDLLPRRDVGRQQYAGASPGEVVQRILRTQPVLGCFSPRIGTGVAHDHGDVVSPARRHARGDALRDKHRIVANRCHDNGEVRSEITKQSRAGVGLPPHLPLKVVRSRRAGRDQREGERGNGTRCDGCAQDGARGTKERVIRRILRRQPILELGRPDVGPHIFHGDRRRVTMAGDHVGGDRLFKEAGGVGEHGHRDGHRGRRGSKQIYAVVNHLPLHRIRPGDFGCDHREVERGGDTRGNGRGQRHAVDSPSRVVGGILRREEIVVLRQPGGGADILHRDGDGVALARGHERRVRLREVHRIVVLVDNRLKIGRHRGGVVGRAEQMRGVAPVRPAHELVRSPIQHLVSGPNLAQHPGDSHKTEWRRDRRAVQRELQSRRLAGERDVGLERQHVPKHRVLQAHRVGRREVNPIPHIIARLPHRRDNKRAAAGTGELRDERMVVIVMLKIHPPRQRRRREQARLGIGARAGKLDGVARPVDSARRGRCDVGDRGLIGGNRERGDPRDGGADGIVQDAPELRAIIRECGGGQFEFCGIGARHVLEIRLVPILALPAEGHGRFSIGADAEGGGVTRRNKLVSRLGAHLRGQQARILDAVQRAAAAGQVVKRPVAGHGQIERHHVRAIDGKRRERRKRADRLGVSIQHVDNLGKSIHEEILAEKTARELVGGGIVKSAAGDGAAGGRVALVGIRVHRTAEIGIGGITLVNRPAVVPAPLHLVDLLPGIESHIVHEQPAGAGFETESVGIAKSQRPDRPAQASGRVHKRIVTRNGAVAIEPENFAQRTGQRLGVGRDIVLPDPDVKFSVGTKCQTAPVVPAGFPQSGQVQQRHLAARFRDIPIGREAAQAVVNRRRQGGVIEIHEMVRVEVGIELDADESAFLIGVNGQGHERVGQQHAALDHPHSAPLFAHKNPAVRRHGQGGRGGDAINARLAKARRKQRLRARTRNAGEQSKGQQPAAEPADGATITSRASHRSQPGWGESALGHEFHNS